MYKGNTISSPLFEPAVEAAGGREAPSGFRGQDERNLFHRLPVEFVFYEVGDAGVVREAALAQKVSEVEPGTGRNAGSDVFLHSIGL